MAVRSVLPLAVGLVAASAAITVAGFAVRGGEVTGASAITRPTKAPVRPTVGPAREFPIGYGEPVAGGPPVE